MTAKQIDSEGYKIVYYGSADIRGVKSVVLLRKRKNVYIAWSYDNKNFVQPVRVNAEGNGNIASMSGLPALDGLLCDKDATVNGIAQGFERPVSDQRRENYLH